MFTVQNLEKETKRDDSLELFRFFVLEVFLFFFFKWEGKQNGTFFCFPMNSYVNTGNFVSPSVTRPHCLYQI